MTESPHVAAIARITAELVDAYEVSAVLQHVVSAASRALGGQPAGILVVGPEGVLELVAASSHVARDLELYHAQVDDGPALDAVRSNADLQAMGSDELAARWPALAAAMGERGVVGVVASPLRWRGEPIGALNVFLVGGISVDATALATMRAMSDLAVVCLLYHQTDPDSTDIAHGLRSALEDRALLELAKGAVSVQQGTDTAAAFRALHDLAEERQQPLPDLARRAVDMASRGRPWTD
jgi:hypothetical protein